MSFSSAAVNKFKDVLKRKYDLQIARRRCWNGIVSLVLASVIYIDLSNGSIGRFFPEANNLFWIMQLAFIVMLLVNSAHIFLRYFVVMYVWEPIRISKRQQQLLHLGSNDAGFIVCDDKQQQYAAATVKPYPAPEIDYSPPTLTGHKTRTGPTPFNTTTTPYSPSSFSPLSQISGLDWSPRYAAANQSPAIFSGSSSPASPPLSWSPSPVAPGTSFLPRSPARSCAHPGGHSPMRGISPLSSPTVYPAVACRDTGTNAIGQTTPVRRHHFDRSSLRSRPVGRISPYGSTAGCIMDTSRVERLLEEDKENSKMNSRAGEISATAETFPFFSVNRCPADYSAALSKYDYQISPLVYDSLRNISDSGRPQSASSSARDDSRDQEWKKIDTFVNFDELNNWVQGLRQWISETIISRVVKESNSINDELRLAGAKDIQIGVSPLSTLKQAARAHSLTVPTFEQLIPFLEFGTDYFYVFKRIQELDLASGLFNYKWNGGGAHQGKPWGAPLPTDSELVMHLVATYMDARLPAHPSRPDGKRFSTECFMKTPGKSQVENPSVFCIFQSQLCPPHFQVARNGTLYDVARGRNNLFYALLLFFYLVQVKDNGKLREVSLGRSGINVGWVMKC